MPSGNPNIAEAGKKNQWQPGQSGNPAGKPKGARHLRSIIQDMLGDDDFEQKLADGTILKGAPIKAITKAAIAVAQSPGKKESAAAREWLAKYGIGTRMDIDQKLEASGEVTIVLESNEPKPVVSPPTPTPPTPDQTPTTFPQLPAPNSQNQQSL